MVPDQMMKLPVTCVRFYRSPVDGNRAVIDIVAATCKQLSIVMLGMMNVDASHCCVSLELQQVALLSPRGRARLRVFQ